MNKQKESIAGLFGGSQKCTVLINVFSCNQQESQETHPRKDAMLESE
jgi:hypothetical protein